MEGFAAIKEDNQRGDLRFSLLEGKPVEVHVLINDYKYYEFSTGYSGKYIQLNNNIWKKCKQGFFYSQNPDPL